MEGGESSAQIIKNAPCVLKADIWTHCGFYQLKGTKELDKSHAVCKVCRTQIKYLGGNTTNLRNHRSRFHCEKLTSATKKTADPAQQRIDEVPSTFPPNSEKAKTITQSVAAFIAKDLRPYSVVENAGFRHLLKTPEPRYKLPSRSHFTENVIPALYNGTNAQLLGRVRRSATFFHRSAYLKEKQKCLGLNNHKLITDVATRWNSAYDMVERFLEQQPAIRATLLSPENAITTDLLKRCNGEAEKKMLHPASALDARFKGLPFLTVEERLENYRAVTEEAASLENERTLRRTEVIDGPSAPKRKASSSSSLLVSSLGRSFTDTEGTSVSAERVSSTAGDVVTAKRSTLKPEHVDQRVFLQKNLHIPKC
ncbi:hypothetical protein KUCAC02_004976 [Chaenocephalus aceratus]|uniref:Uncharacterized protein n=1 Tax=Chaenocephalus aceratus TaxID=36190 RepID=A0ACB9X072_CHAAC|nr:hypothetical protein KUCAC02_004976 [Chaenocephalus aceratus]